MSASILVVKEGKPLCVSRKRAMAFWGLAGGKLEDRETFLEAAVREFLEETGIELLPDELVELSVEHRGKFTNKTFLYTGSMEKFNEINSENVLTPENCRMAFKEWKFLLNKKTSPFSVQNLKIFSDWVDYGNNIQDGNW